MTKGQYDLIVIGSGSGGLSVGLFMAKAGFKVLMVSKSDHDIGGDCLNDGCVPSKSFIHAAKMVRMAGVAKKFGLTVSGSIDINKIVEYVHERQERIREHENAAWLKNQGIDVALGDAKFTGKNSIRVDGDDFTARKIVITTGSRPKRLKVKGVEKVHYYDNESIFQLFELPGKLLVIGGGPIGMEIAQSMQSLGTQVTVVHKGSAILEHDAPEVTEILLDELSKQGVNFYLNTVVQDFPDPNTAKLLLADKTTLDVTFEFEVFAFNQWQALNDIISGPSSGSFSVNPTQKLMGQLIYRAKLKYSCNNSEQTIYSNTVTTTSNFCASDFLTKYNPEISMAWTSTKNSSFTNQGMKFEYGIAAHWKATFYDVTTSSGSSSCNATVTQTNQTEYSPATNGSPNTGEFYTIGNFHTHPPLTYCTNTTSLTPGPSAIDMGLTKPYPQIVLHYQNTVTNGHNINLPTTTSITNGLNCTTY